MLDQWKNIKPPFGGWSDKVVIASLIVIVVYLYLIVSSMIGHR